MFFLFLSPNDVCLKGLNQEELSQRISFIQIFLHFLPLPHHLCGLRDGWKRTQTANNVSKREENSKSRIVIILTKWLVEKVDDRYVVVMQSRGIMAVQHGVGTPSWPLLCHLSLVSFLHRIYVFSAHHLKLFWLSWYYYYVLISFISCIRLSTPSREGPLCLVHRCIPELGKC